MKCSIAFLFLVLTCFSGTTRISAADTAALRASKPAVKQEIVDAIEAQLAAFRKGDVTRAYRFASRALRAQWPLRTFSAIIEANYPEIWSNTRAEFGLARDDGHRATIVVLVHAEEERASYDFMLVKERAGWRIEGVLRREPPKGSQV